MPEIFPYQHFIDNGIIFIPSIIDEELANRVIQCILLINSIDPNRQINLYINSPGGNMFDTFAIYDVLQIVTNPIATYCIGISASASAVILAAGDKNNRYATPYSRILLHQVWSSGKAMVGKTEDVKVVARTQEQLEENLLDSAD